MMADKMSIRTLTDRGLFFIPVGDLFGLTENAFFLYYAPMEQTMQIIDRDFYNDHVVDSKPLSKNGEQLFKIPDAPLKLRNITSVDEVESLYFILTYRCNFKCIYCYSAEGRNQGDLSFSTIETMLKFFLTPGKKGKKLSVNFIGGGEPMLAEKILRKSVVLIRELEKQHGLTVSTGIITNGSLLNNDICELLIENNVQLKISFEVLPEIQQLQRGKFDIVSENIKKYSEHIPTLIRSVITRNNVKLIPAMVERCLEEYPHVKHLKCDPVVTPDDFASPEEAAEFYQLFGRNFLAAMEKCQGRLKLSCWLTRVVERVSASFCPPVFTVTPENTITSCVCYSSPQETGYSEKVFGKIENGTVSVDPAAWENLCSRNYTDYPECADCFLKYHCAGGCSAHRSIYLPEINMAICRSVKNMARELLLKKLSTELKEQYGLDLHNLIIESAAGKK